MAAAAASAAAACRRAVPYTLLGPPAESLRAAAAAATTGDQSVDLLDANFNKPPPTPPAAKTRTENNSPTFATSGDPCLDFFFHVVPGTPPESVSSLLADAWAAEPLTALRLACNLRGVRGTGKSDKEGFYAAALRMHNCHPATLALNARAIAEFGYLKDLPELLHRIIHGGVSTRTRGKKPEQNGGIVAGSRNRNSPSRRPRRWKKSIHPASTREARVAASNKRDQEMSAQAAVDRHRKRADAAARAVERYARDSNYRLLHDMTADLFAGLLAEDMKKLSEGNLNDFSLAAKWCPSVDTCYDRSTLLCEAIARRLFPNGSAPLLPEDLPDAHYAYRARELLRKEAYVPLRHALKLPEIFISARQWGKVVYTRVASVAMNNYKDLFLERDEERFNQYLADVKSGMVKIAAGALLPHQILASACYDNQVAELQWQRTVDDLLAFGELNNCLAVCDVSGSMCGEPMDVCVALGLLLSELCDEPWRHRVITFSHYPQLHHIEGETLWEKCQFIRRMDWDMNTDFQAVFDQLLQVAVAGNLPPERMVEKVFVFSDMEFDEASSRPWETDYEAITRKFSEAGYGEAVPYIVFWNLRFSYSVPVTAEQKGVWLLSGFSKNMLKVFLGGEGEATTDEEEAIPDIPGEEEAIPDIPGEEEAMPDEEEATTDIPGEEEAIPDIPGKKEAIPDEEEATTDEEEAIPDIPGEEEAIPDIPGKKDAIPNIPTPRGVMEKAISGPEYKKLVVFD